MNGAIFFSGRYGSTAQYSRWISAATGLPVYDIAEGTPDPADFDFLVLGSSVVFYRATIRKWLKAHWRTLRDRPLLLFTVSGAPPGPKLDGWIAASFADEVLPRIRHVALRGRLNHDQLGWWLKAALRVGALFNRDPEARKDEMHGFDYMDPAGITPIVRWVRGQQPAQRPVGHPLTPRTRSVRPPTSVASS